MKKNILLVDKVKDENGKEIATLQTQLYGDGQTPQILVTGNASGIIGYDDQGQVILDPKIQDLINVKKQAFMAEAIKEQKELCIENGVDPDLVNIIGLEKKERKSNE